MLEHLLTEQPNPASEGIDALPAGEILRIINDEDAKVAGAVARELPAITRAVDAIVNTSSGAGACSTWVRERAGGWACWTPRSVRQHSMCPRRWCGKSSPEAMPFRAGLFAGALGGLVLVRLAGFLGRSVGRELGSSRPGRPQPVCLALHADRGRRSTADANWSKILARAVGQQTRQLMQPPSQFLELLARHPREVGALDIVQL